MITSSTLLLGAWSCMYVKPLQTTSKAGRQARMHAWCMARFSHAFACPSSMQDPAIRLYWPKRTHGLKMHAHTRFKKKKEIRAHYFNEKNFQFCIFQLGQISIIRVRVHTTDTAHDWLCSVDTYLYIYIFATNVMTVINHYSWFCS